MRSGVLLALSLVLVACGGPGNSGGKEGVAVAPSAQAARSSSMPDAGASPVAEAPARYVQVAAGATHTCALTDGGKVHCWGRTGTTLDTPKLDLYAPAAVRELSDVVDLAADRASTCALRKDGVVLCAFVTDDLMMQAFADKRQERPSFTAVDGLPAAKSIAMTQGAVCAVLEDGGVACAGSDRLGARGLGDASVTVDGAPPSRVPGVAGATRIVAGRDAVYGGFCAIGGGRASCWGLGNPARFPAGSLRDVGPDVGQKPSGAKTKGFATPMALAGETDVDDLAWWRDALCVRHARGDFTCRGGAAVTKRIGADTSGGRIHVGRMARCTVRADGTASCWESAPEGYGPKDWSVIPRVKAEPGVVSLSIGNDHACAVKRDGSVACWGDGRYGQLGTGVLYSRSVPARVDLPPVAQVTAAYERTCARLVDGSVRCWGRHGPKPSAKEAAACEPTTAANDEPRCPTPVEVLPAGAAARLAGTGPVCTRATETAPWRCAAYLAPARLEPVRGVKGTFAAITTFHHGMYGLADGRAYVSTFFPELGGVGLPAFTEQKWTRGIRLAALSSDGHCGIVDDGRVVCACETEGKMTRSAACPAPSDLAFELPDLKGGVQIVHTPNEDVCVVDARGTLKCSRDVPMPKDFERDHGVAVAARLDPDAPLVDVVAIASSAMFPRGSTGRGDFFASTGGGACALTKAGAVHCWGTADAGQVGDATRPSSVAVPRRVEGLPPVVEVVLGAEHVCARTAQGELLCWGSDVEGQLGLGTKGALTTPAPVARATLVR